MATIGSMVRRVLLLSTLAFASAAYGQRGDDPSAATPEQVFVAEQLAMLAEERREAPSLSARPLSEIIRIRLVDGNFVLELLARDVGESAVIPLTGLNGVCQVQRLGALPMESESLNVMIHVVDAANARATRIAVSSITSRFNFDVVTLTPQRSLSTQMNCVRPGPYSGEDIGARLWIQEIDEVGDALLPTTDRSADNAADLIRGSHAALLLGWADGLRLMRSMHLLAGMGEHDAARLLASGRDVPADTRAALARAIEAVRENPASGEKQLRAALDAAGLSGAAYLVRAPREGWSADLTLRVDAILATYLPDDPRSLENVLETPQRLIDLLYWPDAAIRARAAEQLRARTDLPFEFDPASDPYDQSSRIEALRKALAK